MVQSARRSEGFAAIWVGIGTLAAMGQEQQWWNVLSFGGWIYRNIPGVSLLSNGTEFREAAAALMILMWSTFIPVLLLAYMTGATPLKNQPPNKGKALFFFVLIGAVTLAVLVCGMPNLRPDDPHAGILGSAFRHSFVGMCAMLGGTFAVALMSILAIIRIIEGRT